MVEQYMYAQNLFQGHRCPHIANVHIFSFFFLLKLLKQLPTSHTTAVEVQFNVDVTYFDVTICLYNRGKEIVFAIISLQ